MIGQISTQGSINAISQGFHPNTLILGQTNGYICFAKINGDRTGGAAGKKKQSTSSGGLPSALQKIMEIKILDCNISKVIRTTRNDVALGTSKGVHFYKVNQDYSMEPSCNVECL